MHVVGKIEGIAFIYFDERDVVRHKLVQAIVKAYESYGDGAQAPREGRRPPDHRSYAERNPTPPDGRPRAGHGQHRRAGRRARTDSRPGPLARAGVARAGAWRGHRRPRQRRADARLNRSFRGKDYATDVLSFPARPQRRARRQVPAIGSHAGIEYADYLGDVVIAIGVANRQADEAGHSLGTELRVLALHGLLHLLGYDHESDAGRMARVEARLRRRGGLKEGLIERRR